jgi:hypothetical protein
MTSPYYSPSGRLSFSAIPFSLALALIITAVFSGCERETGRSSNDVAAFRKLVKVDVAVESVRWEIFGTPEYTGGVPGPTDYVKLVAEVAPSEQKKFQSRPKTGEVWIAPEAARPWLAKEFRSLLDKHADTSTDLSSTSNCRRFEARIRKTGKAVSGFICDSSGKSLVYLTLSGETEQ